MKLLIVIISGVISLYKSLEDMFVQNSMIIFMSSYKISSYIYDVVFRTVTIHWNCFSYISAQYLGVELLV